MSVPTPSVDETSEQRVADLASVLAEVASASDLTGAARALAVGTGVLLGASYAVVGILEGADDLRLLELRLPATAEHRWWHRIPTGATHPVAEAVQTRALVEADGTGSIRRRWPDAFPDPSVATAVAVPLIADERLVGAIALGLPAEHGLGAENREFVVAVAERVAPSLERIVATSTAADALAKLSFLAGASEVLAGSLDYEATLRTVAELAVPRLADWCAIDLLEEGRLRRVAVAHVDPAKVAYAWELSERYPTDLEAPTGAAAVVRTGRSELVEAVDERLLDALELEADLRQLVRELQLNSGLTVALRARGRTLGVLSLVYAESGRHFGPGDVRFAEDLARRAALAIDNAQLHTETLQVAWQLQRAVLPSTFEDSDAWRVAVHYRPAGHSEVGGDFFDAHTITDGRLVALVGDVMGRGVEAAAAMAQVRAAVRAYLVDEPDPGSVLTRLDRMFEQLHLNQLVTLVYGLLDPERRTSHWHAAGHLPPFLVRAEGTVERLAVASAPPIGVGSYPRATSAVPFGPRDTFLLYSDGLVERRGEDLDEGLARLAQAAGCLAGPLGDEQLATLADDLRQSGHDDDVTVLAIRPLPRPGR